MSSRLAIQSPTGPYLDVSDATAVQMDMQSPLPFGDRDPTGYAGTKTYTITVPGTAHNRALLGYPARLDHPGGLLRQAGWRVLFDGWQILAGSIEVREGVAEADLSFDLTAGLAADLSTLRGLPLRALALGTLTAAPGPAAALALANATLTADTAPVVYPMVRVSRLLTEGQYHWLNLYHAGTYTRARLLPLPVENATLAPMLRLRYVLEKLAEEVGLSLAGFFYTHPLAAELARIIIFTNSTLDELLPIPTTTPTIESVAPNAANFDLRRQMPDTDCAALLRATCNGFCLAPIIDPVRGELVLEWCPPLLLAPYTEDWTALADPIYRRGALPESLPATFTMTAPEDGGWARDAQLTRTLDEVLRYDTTAEAITAVSAMELVEEQDFFVYVESLNVTFVVRAVRDIYTPEDETLYQWWRTLAQQLRDAGTGTAPIFDPGFTTLLNRTKGENFTPLTDSDPITGDFFHPVYEAPLVTPFLRGAALKQIILLTWRGLQPGGFFTGPTPLASASRYNYDEEQVGDISLHWGGPGGLYEQFWKPWHLALADMRRVQYAVRLTAKDLARLDFRKKVRIGEHQYFVKRVQVTLTSRDILPATVELMQTV